MRGPSFNLPGHLVDCITVTSTLHLRMLRLKNVKGLSTVTQPSESEVVRPSDAKSQSFPKDVSSTSSPNP